MGQVKLSPIPASRPFGGEQRLVLLPLSGCDRVGLRLNDSSVEALVEVEVALPDQGDEGVKGL